MTELPDLASVLSFHCEGEYFILTLHHTVNTPRSNLSKAIALIIKNHGREQDASTAHPSQTGGTPTIVIARGEYFILTLHHTVNTPRSNLSKAIALIIKNNEREQDAPTAHPSTTAKIIK